MLHATRAVCLDMARSNVGLTNTPEEMAIQLAELLVSEQNQNYDDLNFCSGKHFKVDRAIGSFGESKIIWIVRDLRDSLISFLYHDLGSLSRKKLSLMVRTRKVRGERLTTLMKDPIGKLLRDRAKLQKRFYQQSQSGLNNENVLLVRYEDFLTDCVGQIRRIANFSELDFKSDLVEQVAEDFSFAKLTGGDKEKKDSFVRKGQSGDWKNYFCHDWLAWLPEDFAERLVKLGYEKDSSWVDQLPHTSPTPFESSRIKLRQSAVYAFEQLWVRDASLRTQFPKPFADFGSGSFYEYLSESKNPAVRRWFDMANCFASEHGLIAEDHRSESDASLGY